MKKIVLAIFSFILCLALVGCEVIDDTDPNTGNDTPVVDPDKTETTLGEVTINFISDEQVVKSAKYSSSLEMLVPEKKGYDFQGWEINGNIIDFNTLKVAIEALKNVTTKNIQLNLNANWKRHKYVISYDVNGGEELENSLVEYKKSLETVPTPVKTDYTFLGWYLDSELKNEFDATTSVEEDFKLYAKWAKSELTVTYKVNGGKEIEATIVKYNNKLDELPTPEKEGHQFKGWYTDSKFGTEFDIETNITEDIEIYAKWEANKMTVKFMESEFEDIVLDWGTSIDKLPELSKEDHIFKGWFKDQARENQYKAGDPVTENMTLYPKFSKLAFIVKFETNGGNPIEDLEKIANTALGNVTATRVGYRFDGWYSDSDLTKPFNYTDIVTENITLYAKWVVMRYTFTIHYCAPTKLDEYGELQELPLTNTMDETTRELQYGETITVKKPRCVGYTFVGWYTSDTYKTEWDPNTLMYKDTDIYAKWERTVYTITFNTNGGTTNKPITVNAGEAALRPSEPTKKGYKFRGWYTDSACTNIWDWSTPVNGDMTLYAKWQEAIG